jgi:hypothetical protein
VHIGEILNSVYDAEVGWRPASGSIKPVHVANGLVRSLTRTQYSTERLHRFVVWWKAGKRADEQRSFEALTNEDQECAAIARSALEFDRARRFLGGLLNADGGMFPAARSSDMTVTCAQMASRSGNDRGLGAFGASLLRSDARAEPLAEIIVKAVSSDYPEDPLTAAVWPLLDHDATPVDATSKRSGVLRRPHNQAFQFAYQSAASALASHEARQGNRLRTLERAVQFICVAPLVHAQFLGADGDAEGRVPLLLAMGGIGSGEVATASESTLRSVYEAFENWLASRLADRIESSKPIDGGQETLECSIDGREVRRIVGAIGQASSGHALPDRETVDARMAAFTEAREEFGRERPALVLATALVSAYRQEYESGGPREFLQGLGRRVGLIYPHFQGRGVRRVRPSTAMLDMLVRACVHAGEIVSINEFLTRLWQRFGIIAGANRTDTWSDAEALAHHGIMVDPAELAANTDALVTQLTAMGMARRYADNVAFVGEDHAA